MVGVESHIFTNFMLMISPDAKHCIHRLDTTSTTKAAHQAIHIRTWKIPQPKSTLAPRIAQILSELGISSQKLVMPTRENVQMMDSLMQAASALAETKKQVDRVEHEIRVARKVLGMEEEEEAEESIVSRGKGKGKGKGKKVGGGRREEGGEGEGAEEEEGKGDADGDADGDGDAEGEDVDAEGERATSVATSVRSMSRKKVRFFRESLLSLDGILCSISDPLQFRRWRPLRRIRRVRRGRDRRFNEQLMNAFFLC